jgi:hypothetical protein
MLEESNTVATKLRGILYPVGTKFVQQTIASHNLADEHALISYTNYILQ